MITYTLLTDASPATRILPANKGTQKRWVVIQNQSATQVGLKFDGTVDPEPLSHTNCFILQPAGSPGDTLAINSSAPYGTEAENYIDAIGFSGGEVVNVQTSVYNNRG